MSSKSMTVSHAASRYVLVTGDMSHQLWRKGLLRHKKLGDYPLTDEGRVAAIVAFGALAPSGPDASKTGQTFTPRRLTIPVMAAAAALLVGGAAVPTAMTLASKDNKPAPASTPSPQATQTAQPGWIYRTAKSVIFLHWDRNGDSVTGTYSFSRRDPSDTTRLVEDAEPFTGVITGDKASLSLTGGVNGSWSMSVRISGANLVLSLPNTDGTYDEVTLLPSTSADYDAARQEILKGTVKPDPSATSAVDAKKAAARYDAAAKVVVTTLAKIVKTRAAIDTARAAVEPGLQDMRNDLATTHKDAEQTKKDAAAHPDDSTVCISAALVASDEAMVAGGRSKVGSAIGTLEQELGNLQAEIDAVVQARDEMLLARKVASGHQPNPVPPADAEVAATLDAARAQLTEARDYSTSSASTADALLAEAKAAADDAAAAAKC